MQAHTSPYLTPRRSDLQGLRALSVVAVILYHARVPGVAGGYVGVDIFFVLSGFFITRKLFSEVERTGQINLARFLTDRAKRLFPNAALVLLATLVFAWLILPGYRYAAIPGDVTAAALIHANFHFAGQAVDYFGHDAPASPVLHFWSLSIEEQFYFVWPLMVMIFAVAMGAASLLPLKWLLAAACLVSFALCLQALGESQPAAFFHTQNRVWQLAFGGLAGAFFERRNHLSQYLRAAVAYLGIAGIGLAVTCFSDELRYPGLWALLPTFAAAALLWGLDTDGARSLRTLLAAPWMTWLGDRSYSLYLWHWPILVLAGSLWPQTPFSTGTSLLCVFLVSTAAYRWIENPARHLAWPTQKMSLRMAAAICLPLGIAALAFMMTLISVPWSSDQRAAAIAAASNDFGPNYADGCHLTRAATQTGSCVYGDLASPRTIVLFGDSHAAQWLTALTTAAQQAGWKLHALTKTSCPSADVTIWYSPEQSTYRACTQWRQRTMQIILSDKPDIVVLANSSHYSGWLQAGEDGDILHDEDARLAWRTGLEKTVQALRNKGIEVAIVRDNPQLAPDYRDCLLTGNSCARPRAEALAGIADDRAIADAIGDGVHIIDFSDELCSATECPAEWAGNIRYQDEHHLTASFAGTLWRSFFDLMSTTPEITSLRAPQVAP